MSKITSSKDLMMLLLYAKGHRKQLAEPVTGKTRLVKMIFLFRKEILQKFNRDRPLAKTALPEFHAYNFGPFSAQVYSDLELLVELGFVRAQPLKEDPTPEEEQEYQYWQATTSSETRDGPIREEAFSLTDLGRQFVEEELRPELTPNQMLLLNEFKARCTSATLRQLLTYVYTKYPDMTTHSIIRDEILR